MKLGIVRSIYFLIAILPDTFLFIGYRSLRKSRYLFLRTGFAAEIINRRPK